MAGFNADHVNPFLMAATKVLKDVCSIDVQVGKPSLKNAEFGDNTYVIIVGITGQMKGQVMIAFENIMACAIASKMCMTTIIQMDEMAISALCELGNIITGNAATGFSSKGISITITPPTVSHGKVSFANNFAKNLSVPLFFNNNKIELNIALM